MTKWKDKSKKPKDDETVLIINNRLSMMPHKAYYEEKYNCYISLESHGALPLDITHWMKLPTPPKQ